MADYSRPTPSLPFICAGMSLRPVDQLAPNKYLFLKNMRVTDQGRLDSRSGLVIISPGTTPFDQPNVHSIRRLNDSTGTGPAYARIVGAGTKLYTDTSATAIDTGYSGHSLSMVPWRPDQSVVAQMYVADINKMVKVNTSGVVASWGLPQPSGFFPGAVIAVAAPAQFGRQMRELVGQLASPAGQWLGGGTAAAPTNATRIAASQLTAVIAYPLGQSAPPAGVWSAVMALTAGGGTGGYVNYCLVDNQGSGYPFASVSFTGGGGTGAAGNVLVSGGKVTGIQMTSGGSGYTSPPTVSITGPGSGAHANAFIASGSGGTGGSSPFGYTGIQPGSLLQIATGASSPGTHLCDVTVEQVFQGAAATTIESIYVFPGGSGFTNIVPVSLPAQMAGNSSSFANPDLSVNDNGVAPGSIVLINQGGANQEYAVVRAVVNGPDGTAMVQVVTTQTHAAGEPIQFLPTIIFSSDTYAIPAPGTNTYASASTTAFQVSAGFGTLTDGSAHSDLTPSGPNGYGWKEGDYVNVTMWVDDPTQISEITLLLDVDISGNNDFAHNAYYYVLTGSALLDPVNAGQGQWQTYSFRLSDMLRIGTDDGSTLQTIFAVQLSVAAVGTVNIKIDSLCLIGGGQVDVGTAVNDYFYRMRWRTTGGSYSNWSPATRAGLHLRRNAAIIQLPSSSYDKADIARFGGALTAWTYVGTTDASQGWQFVDNFSDEAVAANPQAQLDDFQPFPDIDVPHSGTCNIVGDVVTWVSGAQFSLAWAPGSEILIKETVYHLLFSPTSATTLRIVENAGTQNGVPFLLTGPTLMAQPLASVWGPDDNGTIFACGSKFQPGVVFFTNPNSPDNASDKNQIELGGPSDPLIAGVLNAGRGIAVSSKKWWALYPQLNAAGAYQQVELAVGKQLWTKSCICSDGQIIAFLSDDGIYLTTGAEAKSITDEDLRDLFPHDGQAGQPVVMPNGTTVYPPGMDIAAAQWQMRLSICDRLLFFDYYSTVGSKNTLVYDLGIGGWVSYDTYAATLPWVHYLDEGATQRQLLLGGNDGFIRVFDQNYDDTGGGTKSGISCQVNTAAFDAGDFRADKKWGDVVVDYNSTGAAAGIAVQPWFNNYTASLASTTLPIQSSRALSPPFDLSQAERRNLALQFTWQEQVLVRLYAWQPSYIIQPVNFGVTPTDWDDDGYIGAKWMQGCILEADTGNVARTIQAQGDLGVVGATINAQFNGQGVQAFSWPPFITHLVRLVPTDPGDTWKNYKVQWVWEPEPELALYWVTQGTDHDLQAYMHVKEVQIAHLSTVDVTLAIGADSRTLNLTLPNSGGVYVKTHLILPPNKAKIYTYSLTSTAGFRLFKKDCEVKVKQWGSTGPYLSFNPFGGQHRADGARI